VRFYGVDELSPLDVYGFTLDQLRELVERLLIRDAQRQEQFEKLMVENELLRTENQKLRAELASRGGPPPFVKPNSIPAGGPAQY
jgi:regulator of replication initiation timing